MLQQGNTALADALQPGGTRYPWPVLRVDWAADGLFAHPVSDLSRWCQSVELDRPLDSDLPAAVALAEGQSVATLQIVLAGRTDGGLTMAQVFSEYQSSSPLYRVKKLKALVSYGIGITTAAGPVITQQFTGVVRSVSPKLADGTVRIECVDMTAQLRAAVKIPTFAFLLDQYQRAWPNDLGDSTDTSTKRDGGWAWPATWLYDYLLRQNNVSPLPLPMTAAQCAISATLNGGPVAEVGVTWAAATPTPNNGAGNPDYIDAPWGGGSLAMAPAGVAGLSGWGCPQTFFLGTQAMYLRPTAITTWGMGVWVRGQRPADGINLVPNRWALAYLDLSRAVTSDSAVVNYQTWIAWCLRADGDNVRFTLQGVQSDDSWQFDGPLFPMDGQWHYIGVQFQFGTNGFLSCRFRVDDAITTGTKIVNQGAAYASQRAWSYQERPAVLLRAVVPLSSFQMWKNVGAMANTAWSKNAPMPAYSSNLDRSALRLMHLNFPERQSTWDMIRDLAKAEFGAAYADEFGAIRFVNAASIGRRVVATETLDLRHLTDLSPELSIDGVRNRITWSTSRQVAQMQPIYELENPERYQVSSGATRRFTVPVPAAVIAATGNANGYPDSKVLPASVSADATRKTQLTGWPDTAEFADHGSTGGSWWYSTAPNGDERYNGVTVAVDGVPAWDKAMILVVTNKASAASRIRFSFSRNDTGRSPGVTDQGSLRVYGYALEQGGTEESTITDAASIAKYGEQPLDVSSDYYHDPTWTGALMQTLLGRLRDINIVLEEVTVPGDPRRQLLDPVRVLTPLGDMRAQVQRINRRLSQQDGLKDTLTLRVTEPPGTSPWRLGSGRLGTDTRLA